jgi:uncharacterized membrane protein
LSRLRRLVIVIPADENARSLDTDDAIIGRISRARDAQTSYRVAFHYNFIRFIITVTRDERLLII